MFEISVMFAILLFSAICFLFAFVVYFIPIIVAYIRKHKNILQISIMNVFIGWTFIGWIAALLWACNCDVYKEED